ncbi:C69 family dipeptidase [Limosilactobacillus fermentum]
MLAFDPLNLESGLNEDVIVAMAALSSESAQEGVAYLGTSSPEARAPRKGTGDLLRQKRRLVHWQLSPCHHWVARRIPDDAYAVTGNRVAIQEVDFDDPANFMWSDGIQEFVADHHSNPDLSGWNFRRIFGTATVFDQHYNTPRQWYGHLVSSPDVKLDPLDSPALRIKGRPQDHPRKRSNKSCLATTRARFTTHWATRAPNKKSASSGQSLSNRTENSHVLQVRNDLPEAA